MWATGPASFAIASALFRYGTESPFEWWWILAGLFSQPVFVLLWCVVAVAHPQSFRRVAFVLLSLHVPCLLAFVLLPQVGGDAARLCFQVVLHGQWGIAVASGIACVWRWRWRRAAGAP
jgi:hypothetical protein